MSSATAWPSGVKTSLMNVTPDLAIKWLEGNTHNRPIRDSIVAKYAADMRAGRWQPSHQGIAFNCDGTLIDGQHRLYALIESGVKAVPMMVVTGLTQDTQLVIDDHLKRTVVDVLKLHDDERSGLSNMHVSIARRITRPIGARVTQGWSRQETQDVLEQHWAAIEFAIGVFPKKTARITNAQVCGAIARAYYHEDREVLSRFAHILSDGIVGSPKEQAAIVLRNWLLTRGTAAGQAAGDEAFSKSMRAIYAFARGETLNKLYTTKEDLYPLGRLRKRRS